MQTTCLCVCLCMVTGRGCRYMLPCAVRTVSRCSGQRRGEGGNGTGQLDLPGAPTCRPQVAHRCGHSEIPNRQRPTPTPKPSLMPMRVAGASNTTATHGQSLPYLSFFMQSEVPLPRHCSCTKHGGPRGLQRGSSPPRSVPQPHTTCPVQSSCHLRRTAMPLAARAGPAQAASYSREAVNQPYLARAGPSWPYKAAFGGVRCPPVVPPPVLAAALSRRRRRRRVSYEPGLRPLPPPPGMAAMLSHHR